MSGISILGSTGSIGKSTLEVLALHPSRYQVVALTASTNVSELYQQCLSFRPKVAAMADTASAQELAGRLAKSAPEIEVLAGEEGLVAAASHESADQVMAAIVGAAGLVPTLAAAQKGKRILLANKEALVVSGQLFMDTVRSSGATILPIDSEHNAVFQCLPDNFDADLAAGGVEKILLTASGGPFRTASLEDLEGVTPEQACNHPNWDMGQKISVDSATMMNKGLEVIEAHWLFNARPDQIEVVVHPQSIIHSMVQYEDGSVLAQLGNPDMRTPIAHALAWPDRMDSGVAPLDIFSMATMGFYPPDMKRFPCLRLAFEAIETGGTMPAVLNAANEVAVAAFLEQKIAFTRIPEIIERTMHQLPVQHASGLEELLGIDSEARKLAEQSLQRPVS